MTSSSLKLSAFLALAQHEVQQTLEYLAQPEVRQVSAGAPSQVLATIGNVKLNIPLHFAISHSPPLPAGPPEVKPEAGEVLLPGAPWPPGSKMRYQIDVGTPNHHHPEAAQGGVPGTLTIEFITVLKE